MSLSWSSSISIYRAHVEQSFFTGCSLIIVNDTYYTDLIKLHFIILFTMTQLYVSVLPIIVL